MRGRIIGACVDCGLVIRRGDAHSGYGADHVYSSYWPNEYGHSPLRIGGSPIRCQHCAIIEADKDTARKAQHSFELGRIERDAELRAQAAKKGKS